MIAVLYVDDEPDQLEIGRFFLEKRVGFTIETVASASAALEKLKEKKFDAIISDYSMPGMDGIELLRQVRASGNDIPFIIFTGRGREEVVIQALNEGADFYIQKGGDPVSLYTELSSKVNQAVHRRRAEEALRESEEKYRILADTSPEMIYFIDTDGFVRYVNAASARQFHAAPDDLIGKHLTEIFPDATAHQHLEAIRKVVSEGQMIQREITEEFPAGTVWIDVRLSPVIGPDNTILGVLGLSNDVTSRKRAELELEENEERIRTIMQSIQTGVVIIDAMTHDILEANPKALAMIGAGSAEVTGSRCHRFICPCEEGHCPVTDLRQEIDASECVLITSTGTEVPILKTVIPLTFSGKNVLLESFIDISELKEREDRIRLLAGLLDLTPAAITVHDTGGRFMYANEAALRYHGYTGEEFYRLNLHELDVPESARKIDERVEQLRTAGEASFEVEHYRKDRSILPLLVNARYTTWGDKPVILSVATDIEERRITEKALKESESLFRTLVSTMLDTVLILDWDGTVRFANPAAALLINHPSEESITGVNVLLFVKKEHHPRVFNDLTEVREGRGGFYSEYEISAIDGESRWIEALGTRITFMGKEAALIVVRDITRRKQTETLLMEEYSIALSMSSSDSFDRVLECCVSGSVRISGMECGGIYLKDPVSGTLHLERHSGLPEEYVKHFSDFSPSSAFHLLVSQGRTAYLLYKILGLPLQSRKKEDELRAVAIIPVRHLGEIIGCLMVASYHLLEVPDDGKKGLEAIATMVGGAIAEARSREASLESEHRLSQIIEFLPDATFAIDREGKVIAWNRAIEEMTGVPAGTIIGKGDYEYALPFYGTRRPMLVDLIGASQDEVRQKYKLVKVGKDGITGETLDASPRREKATLWGKAVTLYDARGAVLGAIESIRDVTDHRMLEDALIQVNRRLNLLAKITRDDILSSVMVCKALLASTGDKSQNADMALFIDHLEGEIAAIERQVEFTQLYQDLGLNPPKWQNISDLLAECRSDKVEISADAGGTEVFANPMLPFVFSSLLENTIRHGKGATSVRVDLSMDSGGMTIVWEDNGTGIPPDDKEKIFERDYGEHAGVGLFLCREILGITGIGIRECGEPGKGARFEISVPETAVRTGE